MKERLAAMSAEDRKKLYVLLGLVGALLVVLVIFVVPHGGSSGVTPPPQAPTTAQSAPTPGGAAPVSAGSASNTPPASGAVPIPAGEATGAVPVSAGSSGGGTATFATGAGANNARAIASRPDPFEPFFKKLPTPTPPPPPLPPPLSLPSPNGGGPTSLPGFGGSGPTSTVLASLPPVRIANAQGGTPHVVMPPPLNREAGSGDEGELQTSQGQRLSGVILGNQVQAVLEYTNTAGETKTAVVQPGDTVEDADIQVLRIEHSVVNGQEATRMIVRQNGQEHIVELRAAPQQATDNGQNPGGGNGGGGIPLPP